MRQASKRVPDSAEKTVRVFAEPPGGIIPLKRIKNHLDRIVRGSVEETLNALVEA